MQIKRRITIKDVANRKCAIKNDSGRYILSRLLKKVFPADHCDFGYLPYYEALPGMPTFFISGTISTLPAQSAKLFETNKPRLKPIKKRNK